MEHLAWNETLDNYLSTGTIPSDDYYRLHEWQQIVIQELKKAFKRLNK